MLLAIKIGNPLEGIGPLGNTSGWGLGLLGSSDPLIPFEKILSNTIAVLTVSAAIWFIFQIFAGAFQWLASGGEKQSLQNAQKRITNAVIGLFIVVASYTLIGIVGAFFGLEIIGMSSIIARLNP